MQIIGRAQPKNGQNENSHNDFTLKNNQNFGQNDI